MKKLLLVLAALLLSGCATQVAKFDVQGVERSERARVHDLRPASEKEAEVFSLLITNDAYAIYRVAEATSSPSPLRVLQHRAYEKLAGGADAFEMKVHHLVVYRNFQSQFRRTAIAGGIGGLVGAFAAGVASSSVRDPSGAISSVVEPGAFEALAATEFKRALYTEEENPGRGSVHVVYIETEMAGKRVLTRTLAPVRPVKEGEDGTVVAVEAAIRFHLAQH